MLFGEKMINPFKKCWPIGKRSYKVHVDASVNPDMKHSKIAMVVYMHNSLVSTSVMDCIDSCDVNTLEELAFTIAQRIYPKSTIYTDSYPVWKKHKGQKNQNMHLIDSKDNLAHQLMRGKDIPKEYTKPPTYRYEWIRVEDV